MTQDTATHTNRDDDDQAAVIDQLVSDQDINPPEVSPEERRRSEGDLDYQNREEIPRPSQDGDWDADLDEREVAHEEHDNR